MAFDKDAFLTALDSMTVLDGLCNFEKLLQPTTSDDAHASSKFCKRELRAYGLHIHAHAHTHGGRHGDFAQVNTFA